MKIPYSIVLALILVLCSQTSTAREQQEGESREAVTRRQQAGESRNSAPQFTEEVEVEARAPEEAPPTSSPAVAVIEKETIEKVGDHNLTKPFLYAAGSYVSTGTKGEAGLQIRGLDSGKIALLYDGVPIYEPYFGSFDLNSISAEEVQSVKILKGATSVLYGPNVLGGAVNVLTKRPGGDGVSVASSYGSFDDIGLAATASARRERFALLGSVSYKNVDDFEYRNDAGERLVRANSDSDTKSFTGKLYFYPGGSSELVAEAGYVTSEYGIPWATEIYRPRYWRFSDWDRYMFNLGGTFPLSERGYLKARGYYVKHHNVLDAYSGEDLSELDWISTFDNHSYGTVLLGSVLLDERNEIKFSANLKSDHARTQDDLGAEWEKVSQRTISVGAEEHFEITAKSRLMAGASLDRLNKEEGNDKSAFNPIVGISYSPADRFVFKSTFSKKSRFPTMKDLYSSTTGNPDLREERSTNWEVGLAYEGELALTASFFRNRIRDLIQSIRTPEGWRMPTNIGRARISGFELGLRKDLEKLRLSTNYTMTDSEDSESGRPLPLVPRSQYSFMLDILPRADWRLSFWAAGAADIETEYDGEILEVSGYIIANAGISRMFEGFEISARVENLSDASYVTEPGFPMPGRTFRAALRLRMGDF
jgi:iron complex outermembrane receptor protein